MNDPTDTEALLAELDEARREVERSGAMRFVADDLVRRLVALFGWEDATPIHAALHVENAVLNLRADLAVARSEARRATEKHDRLHERLMGIERANVDHWQDGYAAAQRQIATWLRDLGSRTHDEDGLPYNKDAASVLRSTADAIERGDHRP